jgi:hypothetical protein
MLREIGQLMQHLGKSDFIRHDLSYKLWYEIII